MKARVSWTTPQGRIRRTVDAVIDDRQGVFRLILPANVPPGEVLVEADVPDVYRRKPE